MRVFAALPLPEPAIRTIESVIEALKRGHPRLRCVKPAGMHITLHFFGELGEDAVRSLEAVWQDPDLRRPLVHATFGSLGQFPDGGSPRVIWIGIEEGASELVAYAALFQSKIARLGYREDPRGFKPHITLARNNEGERFQRGWIEEVPVPRVDFPFGECVLFQSILKPSGAEYVILKRAAFTRKEDETR